MSSLVEAPPAGDDLKAAARAAGLVDVHARPSLPLYLKQTWQARAFIVEHARSRVQSRSGAMRLGAAWLVLNPVLNGLVFFVVFGILLDAGRGVENYVGFLIVGVFLYQLSARTVVEGSRSVSGNRRLVQAFSFPRAVLPLASGLSQALTQAVAMGAMLVLLLVIPPFEHVTWRWLLVPLAWTAQWIFTTGLAMILARVVAAVPDVQNLLTFGLRLWLYMSGLFYDAGARAAGTPVAWVVEANPLYAFLTITRDLLLYGQDPPLRLVLCAIGWTVVSTVAGWLVFWLGEESYGRE